MDNIIKQLGYNKIITLIFDILFRYKKFKAKLNKYYIDLENRLNLDFQEKINLIGIEKSKDDLFITNESNITEIIRIPYYRSLDENSMLSVDMHPTTQIKENEYNTYIIKYCISNTKLSYSELKDICSRKLANILLREGFIKSKIDHENVFCFYINSLKKQS